MHTYHLKEFDHTGIRISLDCQTWAAGRESRIHLHDCTEIVYVLQGDGVQFIDRQLYPVIAGDLYAVRRGATHSFYTRNGLKFYNLMFTPALFSLQERTSFSECAFLRPLFHPEQTDNEKTDCRKMSFPPGQEAKTITLFAELLKELHSEHPSRRNQCKALLTLLLNEIGRTAQKQQSTFYSPGNLFPSTEGSFHPALLQILDFIHHHFHRRLTLEEIASRANLSETYVTEFFRAGTGVSLVKYINALRIERARKMSLENPQLNISEIAYRCGFSDAGYFTRVFRQLIGCPPREYRRKFHDRTLSSSIQAAAAIPNKIPGQESSDHYFFSEQKKG